MGSEKTNLPTNSLVSYLNLQPVHSEIRVIPLEHIEKTQSASLKRFTANDVAHTQSLGLKRACLAAGALLFCLPGSAVYFCIKAKNQLKKHQEKQAEAERAKFKVLAEAETNTETADFLKTDLLPLLSNLIAQGAHKPNNLESEYIVKAEALKLAFENCLKNQKIGYSQNNLKYFAEIQSNFSVLFTRYTKKKKDEALENIEKLLQKYILEIAGIGKETFNKEYHIARGVCTPHSLENNITSELKEVARRHNHTHSLKYLMQRNQNGQFASQIAFMETHQDFLRVSALKDEPEVQGMGINAQEHSLGPNSVFRSGAFTVHGRDQHRKKALINEKDAKQKELASQSKESPNAKSLRAEILQIDELIQGIDHAKDLGIEGLTKQLFEFLQKNHDRDIDDYQRQLRKEFGFNSLEELRAEITMRRDFCISQALPELIASVMKSAQNPQALTVALTTRSFLHVVESLVNFLSGKERAMIEDMKGTLDYLSQNCRIMFSGKAGHEPIINVDNNDPNNPKMTLTLPLPIPSQNFPSEGLGLTAICFNTAISGVHDLRQTRGVFGTDKYLQVKKFQDEVVSEGLNRLSAYAEQAMKSQVPFMAETTRQAIGNIRKHYSKDGRRNTKDLEGMKLREALVKLAGGQLAYKCKSGKDRTGMKVCYFLGQGIKRRVEQLRRGLSYYITGMNTGQRNAYAINAFNQVCFPPELKPSLDLCDIFSFK